MKDIPKIYQNRVNKEFHNNRMVYTSYDSNNINSLEDSKDIRKKISDIINSKTFIYSKLVNILIGNDIVSKKIIGIHGDNLVTLDNEQIPICSIKDIYIK